MRLELKAYIASVKPAAVREKIKEIKVLFFPEHPTNPA
jgi:hypothetical protein